jgi:hypothetical protein
VAIEQNKKRIAGTLRRVSIERAVSPADAVQLPR